MTGQSIEVSAQIVQGRGPNPSSTFTASSFTYNSSALSGSATSGDGFVTVGLTGIGNYHYTSSVPIIGTQYNPSFDTPTDYIIMGRRANERTRLFQSDDYVLRQGGITVTPVAGIKITGITITYSDATSAGYDFGNTRVTVTPGTYTNTSSGTTGTGTWTGTSTSAITFTNGYLNSSGTYNFPRITSIEVTYEAI